MTILDQLAKHARARVAEAKRKVPLPELKQQAQSMPKGDFAFEQALKKPGVSVICECKKASPSKGLIAPDFPYLKIAKEYEAAGADGISVLTEPKWFLGSDEYPGVGPEHAYLHDIGRAEYVPVTDDEAVNAFEYLAKTEGIIPAIESAHAAAHAMKIAPAMARDQIIVITISGRGDKDCAAIARYRGEDLHE